MRQFVLTQTFSPSKFLFFSFIGICSAWGATPDKVCGRALDESGLPVPRAAVTIYARENGTQITTRANGAGDYCFAQLARGEYLLESESPSLAMTNPLPFTVRADTTKLPDLSLAVTPVLGQITVTGTGFPQSPNETSKQMDVVDANESVSQGIDSLIDSVRDLPGIRMSQEGGPGSFATIQIRGLRSFDTSIVIDGVRLRDSSATQGDASSFLSDLWFTDTNHVEVLQGAGASIYGTNSIAGVVNMTTDQGGGPLHGDIDLQGGMLGQFLGKIHLAGGALRQRLFYSMGFGHVDITEGVEDEGRYRNTGGLGSITYAMTPNLRAGVRMMGAGVFGQLQDEPTPIPPAMATGTISAIPLPTGQIPNAVNTLGNGLPYAYGNASFIPAYGDADNYRTLQFISTAVFLQHQVTPRFGYRLSYQDLDTDRNYVNGPAGLGYQPSDRTATKYHSRIDTANGTAEWHPVKSQLISGGYEFERESFDSPSFFGQTPVLISTTKASQSSNSAFAQDQTTLFGDRLQLSVSGRWQGFSLTPPTFSGVFPVYASVAALTPPSAFTGDVSAAYFIRSTNTKIRSHVGNAYRAPSLYERFGTYFDGSAFSAYGDPRLSPERAISIDFGIDQYFASDKLKLSASYFYTSLQETIGYDPGNLITPATDPFGRYGGYFNTPGGLARGVEISGQAKLPRGVFLRAAYAYTNSIDRISQYGDGQLQTPGIIPNKFSVTVTKQFGSHWDTAFDFLAGDRFLYPLYDPLPPYNALAYSFEGPRRANLSLGYTHHLTETKRLHFYVRWENLANQQYFEYGFPTPGFVARGGVQLYF